MKKLIVVIFAALVFSVQAFAHTAFTLLSSEKKTVKEADLAQLEKSRTVGRVDGSNLTFTEKEIRLVVLTGPDDDMLSFRIQDVRNPNLIVPAGATLKILFVNVDSDMRHDLRFGHVMGEFTVAPDIAETAGSNKLPGRGEEAILQAEEIVIKANENGAYKYFCSVRSHAKGGMWGNIFVGVRPGENVKMAEKTEHVHSPDEDKDHEHAAPTPTASPAPKKPDEHSEHAAPTSAPSLGAKKPDEHAGHPAAPADKKTDTKPAAGHQHAGETAPTAAGTEHEGHAEMRSSINIGEPMSREGSGTSWVPDSSPTYGYMKMFDDGSALMLHGTMFFRYKSVGSSRDASVGGKGSRSRFDAPSMFMAM